MKTFSKVERGGGKNCKTQGEQFGNRLNVTQGTVKKIGITKLFDSRL